MLKRRRRFANPLEYTNPRRRKASRDTEKLRAAYKKLREAQDLFFDALGEDYSQTMDWAGMVADSLYDAERTLKDHLGLIFNR